MSVVSVVTRTGSKVTLDSDVLGAFRAGLRGGLVTAEDAGYNETRALWNAMIDSRPALIARCAGIADVIHCLKLAREKGLLFSVRGAGHNIAGKATCDGGLMIDLSGMRDVRVDPTARTGPGASSTATPSRPRPTKTKHAGVRRRGVVTLLPGKECSRSSSRGKLPGGSALSGRPRHALTPTASGPRAAARRRLGGGT